MLVAAAELVTYGRGMVPVTVEVGATTWTTSLWPKDGADILPLKTAVRRAEGIEPGEPGEPGEPVSLRVHVAV